MKINIEVDTFDKKLTANILGKKLVNSGDKIDIYRNTTLSYHLTLKNFSIDEPDKVIFNLDIVGDLATNMSIFATWLQDNLRGKAEKLTINQKVVEIKEKEIKKIFNNILIKEKKKEN